MKRVLLSYAPPIRRRRPWWKLIHWTAWIALIIIAVPLLLFAVIIAAMLYDPAAWND